MGFFGFNKKRVIVIDDDPLLRQMLSMFVEEMGYEVQAADNGKSGIQLALEHLPVLILLDIQMPEMSGYDTLAYLKKNKKVSSIPVIMVTAERELGVVERCLQAGAKDFIQKPFDLDVVRTKIERVLAG